MQLLAFRRQLLAITRTFGRLSYVRRTGNSGLHGLTCNYSRSVGNYSHLLALLAAFRVRGQRKFRPYLQLFALRMQLFALTRTFGRLSSVRRAGNSGLHGLTCNYSRSVGNYSHLLALLAAFRLCGGPEIQAYMALLAITRAP